MKRIGLTCPALYRAKGGIERFSANLGSWLANNGFEVVIFHYPLEVGKKQFFQIDEKVEIQALGTDCNKNYEILKKNDLDLLFFTNDGCDRAYLYSGLARIKIPAIYSEHAPWWNLENEAWNHYSRMATIAQASAAHFNLASAADNLPDFLKRKVAVIPNCVDIPKFSSPLEKRPKKILSVARLDENDKQLSFLIRAFGLIAKKFPDWRLRICGDGKNRNEYKNLVDELKISGQVEMPGNVEKTDWEYENAQAFCLSSRYECCPISLLEAQAHDLPLVGFKTCYGVNELIKDGVNGVLAPEMSIESLAASLEDLIAHEDKRKALALNSSSLKSGYDRRRIYPQFKKLIAKFLKKHGEVRPRPWSYKNSALHGAQIQFLNENSLPRQPEIKPLQNDVQAEMNMSRCIPRGAEKPMISVILPVYDVMPYLDRCLAMLCRQTYDDFEIIAVDDGSTDESPIILEEWAARDPRIRIVTHERNCGLSAARNTGMKLSRGKYLYFMDSDDWINVDYLQNMIQAANYSKSPVVCNTSILKHSLNGVIAQHAPANTLAYEPNKFIDAKLNIFKLMWITPAYLYSKELLFSRNLDFPEGYIMEDQFFQVAVFSNIDQLYVIRKSAYNYIERPGSICTKKKRGNPNLDIAIRIKDWLNENNLLGKNKFRLFSIWLFPNCRSQEEDIDRLNNYVDEVWDYIKNSWELYSDYEHRLLKYIHNNHPKTLQQFSDNLKIIEQLRKKMIEFKNDTKASHKLIA